MSASTTGQDERVPIPFSHHSHSGQYCGHAANSLEEVVQAAIKRGMTTFCMTEHMPREVIDFYPEEANNHTEESLARLYDDFYSEARRLQEQYASEIQLFVGFEGEWIRKSSLPLIESLLAKYHVDLFVGSVHHVHTKPIDYDTALYCEARDIAGGTDEDIYRDYFDEQYRMLEALRPPVVGHFDLIRLKSDDPNRSFRTWPSIWNRIERNLRFVAEYGGVLELNSSSLRKGMSEAYPQVEICKEFLAMGGRFTVSDDSHGIEQVGLNYTKVMKCIEKAKISEIQYLAPASESSKGVKDERFPQCQWQTVSTDELRERFQDGIR